MVFVEYILKDTLTTNEIVCFVIFDGLLICGILTIAKHHMLNCLPKESTKEMIKKQRIRFGWVLTLLNSFVLSLLAITHTFYRYIDDNDYNKSQKFPLIYIENYSLQISGTFGDLMLGRDNLSYFMCTHFAVVNAIDLVYGSVYYPEAIDLLSGWVHHIVYIWIIILCTTTQGLFLTSNLFAKGFGLFFLLEIPTFILASGRIYKSLRSDYGFGFFFWIFRILLHGYLIASAILTPSSCDTVIQVLLFLTFSVCIFH